MPTYLWSQAIQISNVSDLNFPAMEQDSPAYTIPPSGTETSENASFLITGSSNTSYSIDLPKSGNLVHNISGTKIRLSSFTSVPAEGGNGLLDASGQQMLYVGATRAKLGKNQTSGSYSTSFSVTVIY